MREREKIKGLKKLSIFFICGEFENNNKWYLFIYLFIYLFTYLFIYLLSNILIARSFMVSS